MNMKQLYIGVFLSVLAVTSFGCSRSTTIYVKSTDRTNGGRPLHMMVRTIDEPAPLESYADVAALAYREEPDPSVLKVEVVLPGEEEVVVPFEVPDDVSVIVYFFYTDPDSNRWKVPLRSPVPEDVYIELGDRGIIQAQSK